MEAQWAIRVDGAPGALRPESVARLDAVARSARERLGGADWVSFVEAREFRGRGIATVAIGRRHGPVRAERVGSTLDAAVAACCDSIEERLDLAPSLLPRLSERPPVCEALLRTWLVPTDCGSLSSEDLDLVRDERFAYHLSDGEALARAELAGDAYFLYGAKGRCATKALIRVAGGWHRLDDVERPAWQLPEGGGPPSICLVSAAGSGSPSTVTLSSADVIQAPTFAAALEELDRRKLARASCVIAEWGSTFFLVREAPGWVRAFGYEADVYRIDPATGPFGVPTWAHPGSRKADKRTRLREALACPRCRRGLGDVLDRGACPGCGSPFTATEGLVDFLGRRPGRIVHDPEASRNTPSKQIVHDLRLHPDGLVLNVGAGDSVIAADNLVNLEIVAYPTTDVVADAGALPFADGAFDTVFSQSVLEHVKDPFACAREMQRVLRQGGTLHADAPFIAPFHGYPDHYFNPTMNGLRQLFAGLEEIDVREGPHHAPSITLFEILGRFCTMIRSEKARQELLSMPVKDLLDLLHRGLRPEITRDLDPERTFEISAGFSFYGVKR
jgi:SAM-dependent methyltransferase